MTDIRFVASGLAAFLFMLGAAVANPSVTLTPDGPAAAASVTVDGVEYPPADIEALAQAYKASPESLDAGLPGAVRDAVYALAAALPAAQ